MKYQDLKIAKQFKRELLIEPYRWGKIKEIHEIGEYLIVEYWGFIYENSSATKEYNKHSIFHPYVNCTDTNRSLNTLDEALAFCIAYKAEGPNTRAHQYFIKGIKK